MGKTIIINSISIANIETTSRDDIAPSFISNSVDVDYSLFTPEGSTEGKATVKYSDSIEQIKQSVLNIIYGNTLPNS